ncbi:MAG: TMEM14 family protein [Verrucomicrobia bacterium]|nr:TMEM14 family protein [Verrucomicrobiota bacterium]
MGKSAGIVCVYGLLVLIGGLIGHFKAASAASLIAGGASGVLLLVCSWALYKRKKAAYPLSLLLVILLDAFFTYRFALSLKFLPSGLMSLISLTVLVLLALNKPRSAG